MEGNFSHYPQDLNKPQCRGRLRHQPLLPGPPPRRRRACRQTAG